VFKNRSFDLVQMDCELIETKAPEANALSETWHKEILRLERQRARR